MPRFTEEEKVKIKSMIMEKGKDLFTAHGLNKTSIDKIVDACGIGKGTFYNFFQSKEELYFEILLQEEFIIDEFMEDLFHSNKPPQDLLKDFLEFSIQNFEDSLFLRGSFERNEYFLLQKKLPAEVLSTFKEKNINKLTNVIHQLIEGKIITELETNTVVGIIRSLYLVSVNKKIIGEDIYPVVIKNLISFVSTGLSK